MNQLSTRPRPSHARQPLLGLTKLECLQDAAFELIRESLTDYPRLLLLRFGGCEEVEATPPAELAAELASVKVLQTGNVGPTRKHMSCCQLTAFIGAAVSQTGPCELGVGEGVVGEVRWGRPTPPPGLVRNLLIITKRFSSLVIVVHLSIRWQTRNADIVDWRDRFPVLELRHPNPTLADWSRAEQVEPRAKLSREWLGVTSNYIQRAD